MSATWQGVPPPPSRPLGAAGWLRVALKGPALALLVFGGLAGLLVLRLVERPLHGLDRPWTPFIAQGVCRTALALIGLRVTVRGQRMSEPGAVVANHSSWLDILALNARKRIYFVSKAEVARWPGIGWLARSTGTVFITRDPREAKAQTAVLAARLEAGHKLLFFPEGTSSDGLRILPFKSTLFAAFLAGPLRDLARIQPVTLVYEAPKGESPRFYGWWGDMDFGAHLLRILAAPRHGRVEVIYHDPLRVADLPDRKALARRAEAAVRAGFPDRPLPEGG